MRRQQGGFALIAAIILICVLAALAAFTASMVSAGSAGGQMTRAGRVVELAADTGLEWGAHRVLRGTPAPVCTPTTVLPALAAYPGVRITVTCAASPTTEPALPGPGMITIYAVTATATVGGTPTSPDYAERSRSGVFSR
jgi:type II secretory pathway pseudopilin PulG